MGALLMFYATWSPRSRSRTTGFYLWNFWQSRKRDCMNSHHLF